MAVDPGDVDAIAASVAGMYRDAEEQVQKRIARELRRGLDAPTWAEDRLTALQALRRAAEAIAAALERGASDRIRRAVSDAFRAGSASALAQVAGKVAPGSGIAEQAQAAVAELPQFGAIEALASALQRDAAERAHTIVRSTADVYQRVITQTVGAETLSGGLTRREAAQLAWQRLQDRGVTSFVDASGARWRLSTYVEMAARTVTQRAAVAGQEDRLRDLGVNLVYISDAPQECALCRPFEGRVLSLDGATGDVQTRHALTGAKVTVHVAASLAEARLRGLFHPNCRHSLSAYLPGVTRLPAQPTRDPEGDKARRRQREIERGIRHWRERASAAVDPAAARKARRQLRWWQDAMRDHLAAHPQLKRLPYREGRGAGNIPAGR